MLQNSRMEIFDKRGRMSFLIFHWIDNFPRDDVQVNIVTLNEKS